MSNIPLTAKVTCHDLDRQVLVSESNTPGTNFSLYLNLILKKLSLQNMQSLQ